MDTYRSSRANPFAHTVAFFNMFGKTLSPEQYLQYLYVNTREEAMAIKKASLFDIQQQMPPYEQSTSSNSATSEAFKKLKKYTSALSQVPGVRMIAVGNTHAFAAATEDSDIDLFVVSAKGYIWITRLCMVILCHVLGVRRHGKKVAGRFCLSFFVSEDALALDNIALPEGDPYLDFWIATLKPIYGQVTYKAFVAANKEMFSAHFPFWRIDQELHYLDKNERASTLKKTLEWLLALPLARSIIRSVQKRKMDTLPVQQTEFSSIVVSDTMLKFHNNDRRTRYRTQMKEALL